MRTNEAFIEILKKTRLLLNDYRIIAFGSQTGVIIAWLCRIEDAFLEERVINKTFLYLGTWRDIRP